MGKHEEIKVVSCNIRGLVDAKKRRKVFHYFHMKKYDVILLQECHCTKTNEKLWCNEWEGRIVFSNGTSQN